MKMTKHLLTRPTLRGLVLALAVTALSSFVARAIPYASQVTKTGDHVTFILNHAAQGLAVLTNGVPMAHSIDYSTPGEKSFDMPGATTYSIIVTGNTAAAWSKYVADGTERAILQPIGVSIDKNPSSTNFGKVFVSNATTGTTTNSAARSTAEGIWVLRADGAAFAGPFTGGVTWGGTLGPNKSCIGPDGHLYVADLSNDLCYELSPDLSSATQLIYATNKTTSQYVNSIYVTGTQAGGDRKIYLVNGYYANTRTGLIEYNLGANPAATDTGTQVVSRAPFGNYYPYDVARDSKGDWYICSYRSATGQAPPIVKFNGAGTYLLDDDIIWSASNAYAGGPRGIDINEKAGIVAYAQYEGGTIYIFDTATGAFLESFSQGVRASELAFDAAGNMVTLDYLNQYVRFWSPGGKTVALTSSDGTSSSFQLVNLVPDVKVTATVDTTTEGSAEPGVFSITRKADDTSAALTVNYVLTGIATNGTDYTNLTGSVVIPAGATNAEVYVQALDDTESETTETVILTLSTNANYVVKTPSSATVKIADTDIPVLSVTITPSMYERVPGDYATLVISRNLGNTNVGILLNDVASVLTTGGTAVSGTDYTLDTGALPLYLNNGVRAVTNNVALLAPIDNNLLDGPRTVVVGIVSGADYVAATNLATCTIIDDEDPTETVIWSDNFNTDSSANYVVKFAMTNAPGMAADYSANFNYDYSGYGVPAAPHSGTDTHGLMLNVNKDLTLGAAGLNLYPSGRSFSGNFALRFDMYLFDGSVNNTEYCIFGINHDGTKTNWFRLSTGGWTNSSYDGVWGVVESDASGTDDYILFTGPATTSGTRTPTYRARAGATAFKEIFKSPPFSVTGGSPANDNGSGTPTWADVELAQVGTLVTLRINHTTVLQYNNTVAATSGNIMLGYNDAYDSIGDSTGVIYDNVRVVQLNPPTIVTQPTSAVLPTGGSTNLSVVASGTTTGVINYQWQFNGVAIAGATTSTLTRNNVQLADYGAYTVVVSDGVYSVTSDVANLTVVPSGIALGNGTGLQGGYWTLHTNTAPYTGSPTLTRLDSNVNFDWVIGSPTSQISTDYFTARWVGQIQALSSGTDNYTFTTISDDGARLWVNGQLVVDSWILQGSTPRPGIPIALTGTNKYDIIMEYFEQTGNASAKLYWSNATTVGYSAVPQSQLYPADGVVPAISLTAPANGSSYIAPATINLAANITATNKNLIQYVSFYRGATLIGSVTNAPYQYAWTAVPAGTYPITAAVVYNTNWLAFSAVTNSVTVTALVAPTISGISGNSLNYSGGSGSQFVLLKTANVLAAGTVWTREATNTAPSGSFTIPVGSETRAFYTIKSE